MISVHTIRQQEYITVTSDSPFVSPNIAHHLMSKVNNRPVEAIKVTAKICKLFRDCKQCRSQITNIVFTEIPND